MFYLSRYDVGASVYILCSAGLSRLVTSNINIIPTPSQILSQINASQNQSNEKLDLFCSSPLPEQRTNIWPDVYQIAGKS